LIRTIFGIAISIFGNAKLPYFYHQRANWSKKNIYKIKKTQIGTHFVCAQSGNY